MPVPLKGALEERALPPPLLICRRILPVLKPDRRRKAKENCGPQFLMTVDAEGVGTPDRTCARVTRQCVKELHIVATWRLLPGYQAGPVSRSRQRDTREQAKETSPTTASAGAVKCLAGSSARSCLCPGKSGMQDSFLNTAANIHLPNLACFMAPDSASPPVVNSTASVPAVPAACQHGVEKPTGAVGQENKIEGL